MISILWDLDGTIIDSVNLYYQSFRLVFDKYHLKQFDTTLEEYQARFFGTAPDVFLRAHINYEPSAEMVQTFNLDYWKCSNEYLLHSADGGIHLLPGVDRVLDGFIEKGYPMAIASTSWMPNVVRSLERVGLLEKFANIASGYLLPTKPAPDVFQLAAALNHVPCSRCVVFEDSLAGMKGAKAAGMKCVGISTSVPVSKMADADIRIGGYDLSVVDKVEKMMGI
jgi:HAD superfamily hydrolase (TIGR01509 family)